MKVEMMINYFLKLYFSIMLGYNSNIFWQTIDNNINSQNKILLSIDSMNNSELLLFSSDLNLIYKECNSKTILNLMYFKYNYIYNDSVSKSIFISDLILKGSQSYQNIVSNPDLYFSLACYRNDFFNVDLNDFISKLLVKRGLVLSEKQIKFVNLTSKDIRSINLMYPQSFDLYERNRVDSLINCGTFNSSIILPPPE